MTLKENKTIRKRFHMWYLESEQNQIQLYFLFEPVNKISNALALLAWINCTELLGYWEVNWNHFPSHYHQVWVLAAYISAIPWHLFICEHRRRGSAPASCACPMEGSNPVTAYQIWSRTTRKQKTWKMVRHRSSNPTRDEWYGVGRSIGRGRDRDNH